MPELPGIVETVADNELVLDLETDVFNHDVHFAAAWLAQQARRPKGFRVAGAEHVLQVVEREPRVNDVFDDNDVSALERNVEILQEPNLAGTFRRGAVARDGDEVERNRPRRHCAREVREKHERALENGHEVQCLTVGVLGVDLRGQLGDSLMNLFCGE